MLKYLHSQMALSQGGHNPKVTFIWCNNGNTD